MVIALDPGHGGSDPGAVNGVLIEKDLNLKIATYCKEALEQYNNIEVYMTRSTDEYVGLTERVTRAVNAGADVFISFHINSTVGATGFEVWIQNDSSWRYYLHEESSALGTYWTSLVCRTAAISKTMLILIPMEALETIWLF